MKKYFLFTVIFALAFSACTGNRGPVFNPSKDYWNEKTGAEPNEFSETLVYKASFEGNPSSHVDLELEDGSYTAALTLAEDNGEKCYSYQTVTRIKGKYVAYSVEETGDAIVRTKTADFEFEDAVTETSLFKFSGGAFTFIRSSRSAQSTVPTNRNGEEDENGNRFVKLEYEQNIEYGDRDLTSRFEIKGDKEKLAKYFALEDGFEGKLKKYKKNANFIDVNLLDLFPRTFDFSGDDVGKSLSYSFSTFDALSNSKYNMSLAAYTTNDNANAIVPEKLYNITRAGNYLGSRVDSENGALSDERGRYDYVLGDTALLSLRLGVTGNGSPMILKYITTNPEIYRHYMYQKRVPMPYGHGTLVYTLTQINPI